jgi:hypothetical protein
MGGFSCDLVDQVGRGRGTTPRFIGSLKTRPTIPSLTLKPCPRRIGLSLTLPRMIQSQALDGALACVNGRSRK